MANYIAKIINRCNANCAFCADSKEIRTSDSPPFFELVKELEKQSKKYDSLIITGGEPLIHPKLLTYLKKAKKLGYRNIMISTNGLLLSYEGLTERLSRYIDMVQVSFQTTDAKAYDKITGIKNSLALVEKGMKNAAKYGITVFSNTCLHKLNYKDTPDIVRFAEQLSEYIQLSYMNPVGTSVVDGKSLLAVDYDTIMPYIRKAKGDFMIENIPICIAPDMIESISDIHKENKEYYTANKTKPKKCNGCKYYDICDGVWDEYLAQFGDSELRPAGFEDIVNNDLQLFKRAIGKKPNINNIYDTYSYFLMKDSDNTDQQEIRKYWIEFVQSIKEGRSPDLLSMYLSIPFCKSNCSYCVYPSIVCNNQEKISSYVDYLCEELKKNANIFKDIRFKSLYIGGGTPSILNLEQMDRLFSTVFSNYNFHDMAEKAIELNPRDVTEDMLTVIKKHGFNKVSFGVQSFSKKVLEINNRSYQSQESVKNAIELFKKSGIELLNVDIILGMKGDTVEEFLATLRKLIEYGAPLIFIYPMKTNRQYIKKHYTSRQEFEDKHYRFFVRVMEGLKEIIRGTDFAPSKSLDSISYVAPIVLSRPIKSRDYKFTYGHFLKIPYSIFSLGFYAYGRMSGVFDYIFQDRNRDDSMFLKDFSLEPKDYYYSRFWTEPEFDRVKFIVQEFYHNWEVSIKEYKELFGTDINEDFSYAVRALVHLGIIEFREDKMRFTESDEKKIYPYMLFFVGRDNVLKRQANK